MGYITDTNIEVQSDSADIATTWADGVSARVIHRCGRRLHDEGAVLTRHTTAAQDEDAADTKSRRAVSGRRTSYHDKTKRGKLKNIGSFNSPLLEHSSEV